jgi:phosphoglycerol transferase MdoB-like AlkP superfamily enzyme
MDTVFTLLLGIGLLAFLVITQEYYLKGVQQGDLIERFARVSGPIFLGIFIVDSILFFMQGFDPSNWYRFLIILAELVVGIILIIISRKERQQQVKLIE